VWIDVAPGLAQANVVRRMIAEHARLLAPAELDGKDNTRMPPRSVLAQHRGIEVPTRDEGFAALERVTAVRVEGGVPGRLVAADRLADLRGDRPEAVLAWRPAGAPATPGWLVCDHPAGPPICWCRPPLPGLPIAWAAAHGVDLSRSEIIGGGPAFRTMAAALGAHWTG
jgi:hypothetical protein